MSFQFTDVISRKHPFDRIRTDVYDETRAGTRGVRHILMTGDNQIYIGTAATPDRRNDWDTYVFTWFHRQDRLVKTRSDMKRTDVCVRMPFIPQRDQGRYDYSDVQTGCDDYRRATAVERTIDCRWLLKFSKASTCVVVLSRHAAGMISINCWSQTGHEMGTIRPGMKASERET
jgi:hypothetical protein